MEVHPGVFVSLVATEAWEPDSEAGGEMHVLYTGVGVEAGLSRYAVGGDSVVRLTLPDRETLLVLEGAARVEIAGGPTLDLRVGDLASLPKGAQTTWHLTLPFRKFWAIGS